MKLVVYINEQLIVEGCICIDKEQITYDVQGVTSIPVANVKDVLFGPSQISGFEGEHKVPVMMCIVLDDKLTITWESQWRVKAETGVFVSVLR